MRGEVSVYRAEAAEGKYWGIEHDLLTLTGRGLAAGVFAARFDYVYAAHAEPRAYQAPWRDGEAETTIPNARFPSDHLPVAVALRVK